MTFRYEKRRRRSFSIPTIFLVYFLKEDEEKNFFRSKEFFFRRGKNPQRYRKKMWFPLLTLLTKLVILSVCLSECFNWWFRSETWLGQFLKEISFRFKNRWRKKIKRWGRKKERKKNVNFWGFLSMYIFSKKPVFSILNWTNKTQIFFYLQVQVIDSNSYISREKKEKDVLHKNDKKCRVFGV